MIEVKQPRVRNIGISPSRVYAPSPHRPTAVYGGQTSNYLNQLNDAVLRATNVWQVSNKSTIDHIRRQYDVDSGHAFETVGVAGGLVGATVATGAVLYAYAAKDIAAGVASIGAGAVGTATGAAAPVGISGIALGALKIVGAIGTIFAGYKIGKTVSQMALTPEGRIFSINYFKNLGNSFSARPISTVLSTASSLIYPLVRHKLPLRSLPAVQTFIYMQLNKGLNYFGNMVDKSLFGEPTYQQQISYTTLSASVGDVYDMTSGNPFIRGALMSVIGKPDKAVEKIGAAYGLTDEYDPFLIADLRVEMGVDLGTFANGIVDTLGEIVIDANFASRNIENSIRNKVTDAMHAKFIKKIIDDPDGHLARLILDEDWSGVSEYLKLNEDFDLNIESIKQLQTSLKGVKDNAARNQIKSDYLNKILRPELYEIYKTLTKKPEGVRANSKTRKEDLVKILSELDEDQLMMVLETRFKNVKEAGKQKLKTEGKKPTYKDSNLGKMLSNRKILHKLIGVYTDRFTPETNARTKEQLTEIKASNQLLAISITQELEHFLRENGISQTEIIKFSSEFSSFLLDETSIYDNDMNVVKNTKQQITQDLNTVVQDIRQRGQGSYFENSGFSFDSMIAKEALERGYRAGERVSLKLLNKLPQWRFQTETLDKFTNALTYIVDPVNRFSRFGIKKGIEKIKTKKTEMDSINIETLKEHKITLQEYKEVAKIEDEIYKQMVELHDEILNNKLATEVSRKLNKTIKELDEDLKTLQEEYKNKKADEETINKEKEIVEKIKKAAADLSVEQNARLQELYKNDPMFRTYYRTIQNLKNELESNARAIEIAKGIVTDQKVTWKHIDRRNTKGEETYSFINEYNETKAKRRLKYLEENEETLDPEDTEELTNLKINMGIYNFNKENKAHMIGILERKRIILHSVSGLEMRFSGAMYAVNSMTHKILKYGPHKKLAGITVDQYGQLKDLYKEIKNPDLTESERNEIIRKSGFEEDVILEIGKLDSETKDLLDKSFNKKGEQTQDQTLQTAKEQSELIYGDREIFALTAEEQMKNQLTSFLGADLAAEVMESIKNNDRIELNLSYATEFLSFLNPTIKRGSEDEMHFRFILNDRNLAEYIKNYMEKDSVKDILNLLALKINYDGGTGKFIKTERAKTMQHLNSFNQVYLLPLIKEIEAKGMLKKDQSEHLQKNINYLATAIISTHKKMNDYRNDGKYKVRFNEASQTQIGAWLLDKFKQQNKEWDTLHQFVDLNMYELNKQIETLENEVFNNSVPGEHYLPIEKVRELLRRQTISLFSSNIIKAMGHEYYTHSSLKNFYEAGIKEFDTKQTVFTKEQVEKINQEYKDVKKEVLKENLIPQLTNSIYSSIFESIKDPEEIKALEAIGLDIETIKNMFTEFDDGGKSLRARNFSSSSFNKDDLERKRAIDDADEYNKIYIETALGQLRKQNPDLSEDEINKIEIELLETLTKIVRQEQRSEYEQGKNEYREELKKEEEPKYNVDSEEEVFNSTMIKYLYKAGFHHYIDVNNLHKLVRGNLDRISGHIVFDRTDGNQTDKNEVLKITHGEKIKNEDGSESFVLSYPTPENINKLLNLSDTGVFRNHTGTQVRITSLRQLEHSGVLNDHWKDALYETEFKINDKEKKKLEDLDRADFAFLKGLDADDIMNNDEFYKTAIDNALTVPSKIREQRGEELYSGKNQPKFSKVYKGDLKEISETAIENQNISKGSLVYDLLKIMTDPETSDILSSYEMEVSDSRVLGDNEDQTKNTHYRIIRLISPKTSDGEKGHSFELYVPESFNIDGLNDEGDERERKTHFIEGNEYIRQHVAGEGKTSESVQYILKQIINEMKYGYTSHKELNPESELFELRASQRSLFNIFYDQRFTNVGFTENEISEFLWVNPENTDYEKLLLYNEDRLDKNVVSTAVYNNDIFTAIIKSYNNDEVTYSFRSVSNNPNSIYKELDLNIDENGTKGKVDLNDLFLPYNRNTKEVQRSSIVLNAIKNQKIIAGSESPLIQTLANKYNPELDKYNNGGINLRTHVNDFNFKGKANYEDATLISHSAVRRIYGLSDTDPIPAEAFKLINRHSAKQSTIIISDEEMFEITKEQGIEVTVSRTSMVKRGLYGMMQELYDTKDYKRDGKVESAIKHVDNNNNLDINGENASEVKSGFIYYYLTDNVDYGRENADGTGVGYKVSRENFGFVDSNGESFLHRHLGIDVKKLSETDGPNYNRIVRHKYRIMDVVNGKRKEHIFNLNKQEKEKVENTILDTLSEEERKEWGIKEEFYATRIVFSMDGDQLQAKTEYKINKKDGWTSLISHEPENVNIQKHKVDGITLGIEELDTFESLKYIRDSEGNIIDENGIFVNWIYENSFDSIADDKKMQRLFNSTVNISGKPGDIKSRFAKRSIGHSGYNVILPDTLEGINKDTLIDKSLQGNVIAIPAEQAVAAGIAYKTINKEGKAEYHFMDVSNSHSGVVLRYPTVGRQSFIHFEVVLETSPERSKAIRLSTTMHKLLNADHDGDRVAWFSLMGASQDVVDISKKAFGHNYEVGEKDYSDFASRPGFQEEARVNRDNIQVVEEEAGKIFNEETGEWEYSPETEEKYKEFLDQASNVRHDDEAYEQSFEKQKTLKEYSGLLTGLFDEQLQMFLNSKENQKWFSEITDKEQKIKLKEKIKTLENKKSRTEQEELELKTAKEDLILIEKLDYLKISDFPSLIYFLKQEYSQRTFDFSKHGKEEHKISFELVYRAAQTVTRENFMTHVRRLVNVVEADVKLTRELEENINNLKDGETDDPLLEKYKEELTTKTNAILQELKTQEEEFEQRARDSEFNINEMNAESTNVFNDPEFSTTNKEVTERELNELAEKHNFDFNSEEYKEDLQNLFPDYMKSQRAMKLGYNITWNIGNQEYNQVFNHMANIMIKNLKDNVQGMRRLEGTEFFGLFKKIKHSLYKILDNTGVFDPGALNQLTYNIMSKNGQEVSVPITDLFYVYSEDKYGREVKTKITPANAHQFLSIENRNKYRINLDAEKLGIFNEELATFYIDSSTIFLEEDKIFDLNQQMFNEIDDFIVKFMERTGQGRLAGVTPLLYGKAAYETNLHKNLFLDLSAYFNQEEGKEIEPKSQLGKALISMYENPEENESAKAVFNALKGYMGFNVFSQQVNNGSIDNMTRILFEDGISTFNETPPASIIKSPEDFIATINHYDIIRTTKENYKDVIRIFKENTKDFYLQKYGKEEDDRTDMIIMSDINQLILDMVAIFNKHDFNPKNNFFQNTFEYKMNYLSNLQKIRYGSMLGSNTEYNFSEEDIDSMRGRSSLTREDERIITLAYNDIANAFDNPAIDGGLNISLSIRNESNIKYSLGQQIKELGRNLRRHITSEEEYYNNQGFMNYDQSKERIIFLKNSLEGKRLSRIMETLSKAYYSDFDLEGSQSEIAKEIQNLNKNKKISQNLLSLYINASPSTEAYIQSLEETLDKISLEGYPLNLRILQQTLLLNKFQLSLNPNLPPILPHTILEIGKSIYSNLSLEHFSLTEIPKGPIEYSFKVKSGGLTQEDAEKTNLKGITMNNVYSVFYHEYRKNLTLDPDPGNNNVIVTQEEAKLNKFLTSGNNVQMFGLDKADEFLAVMFGKILYDNHVSEVESSIIEQISYKDNLSKEIGKQIQGAKELTENKLFKTSSDAVDEIIANDLFDEDQLRDFFVDQYKEEFIKEQKNLTRIKNSIQIYKDKSNNKIPTDNIVDTYFVSLASNVFGIELDDEEKFNFKAKSLRNVHHQLSKLIGLEHFEDSDDLAKHIEEKYKDHLTKHGVDIKNKKVHTAMIDTLITHEVLQMFGSKEVEGLLSSLTDEMIDYIKEYNEKDNNGNYKNRSKYILFDNETQVDSNVRKQNIYELSYITFDESGLPVPKQHFFFMELTPATIAFLDSKGFGKTEINNIKEEMEKGTFFDSQRKIIEEFLELSKDKNILGHNIQGDIDQINTQYELLIRKELRKAIEFAFVDEDSFMKEIDGLTPEKLQERLEQGSPEDISDGILEKFKEHKWKNHHEFQGRLFRGLIAHMHMRIKEEFMLGSTVSYSDAEKEHYATIMTEMADSFVRANNTQELKDALIKILRLVNPNSPIYIEDDALEMIVQKYNTSIINLKTTGSFMFKFNESEIGEYGNIIPKETELLGIGKIEDDGSFFSESMFKLQSFYNILDELKTIIDFNGISYKEFDHLKFAEKEFAEDLVLNKFIVNSQPGTMTHVYYQDYLKEKSEGNLVQQHIALKKAISSYKRENDPKQIIPGLTNIDNTHDALDNYLANIDLQDPEIRNLSPAAFQMVLNKKLEDISRIHAGLDPRDTNTATKLKTIGYSVFKLGKDALNENTFLSLLGSAASTNPELTKKLYNTFIENYNKMKQDKKLDFYTHNGTLMSNIEYAEEIDRQFIQFAFYSLADQSNELQDFFFNIIDEDFDLEDNYYSEYEERSDIRREFQGKVTELYEPVKELVNNRRVENVFNKTNFSKSRLEFKNKILEGLYNDNWNELISYLNDSPTGVDSNEFVNYFKNKLQELIQTGIVRYTNDYYIDETGTLNYRTKTDDTIHWDPNNNQIKLRFIKYLIDQEYDIINKELYVDTIRTTVDIHNDTNEKISFSEYNMNINKYGGHIYKSSFIKDHEMKTNLNEAKKYINSTSNRIEQLGKYQGNFLDYIESYKKDDGTYYVDELFEAIKNGFLGKNFAITLISDIYDSGARSRVEDDKFGLFKDDLEEINATTKGKAFLEKLKTSNSPVLKTVKIDTKEDLEYLLSIAEDVVGLGFSSNYQLYEANKISYENYEVPKHIKRIEQSIVKMQKFAATVSPGFWAKMIYNNVLKNAVAILGTDNPLVQNMNFLRHAAQVADLDSQFANITAQHSANSGDLASWARRYLEISKQGENVSEVDVIDFVTEFREFLTPKIASLDYFLNEYISEEGVSDRRMISEQYEVIAELKHQFEGIAERIDSFENSTDLTFAFAELNQIIMSVANSYYQSDFSVKLVMLAGEDSSKFDFFTDDQDTKDKNLETFNILSLINKTERMGMMHTPFDLSGAKEAVEFYQIMNNKAKREIGDGLLINGVDWIVNHSNTGKLRKHLMNKITRYSRIHGLLLDTYVNGQGHTEALNSSLHRFFNFGDKSPLERDTAIFYPFAGYFVRDLEYQLDMMTNPRYMRLMTNIHQGIQSWYNRDEDDEELLSPWYARMVENQAWVPMGKNWGIKLGNPMHNAIHAVKNPYEAMEQRKNPLIRGIESAIGGKGFDPGYHASLSPILNAASAIQKVTTGSVRNPADIMPSLFYQDTSGYKKYTPRNYRVNYDYRNLNRQLFFPDGTRRTTSKNPFTTAKNIRYQALVNRSINRRRRG